MWFGVYPKPHITGHEETRLGLLAVRKLSFVSFLLREIVTHSSFLTGTAFRFASALPKSAELLTRLRLVEFSNIAQTKL